MAMDEIQKELSLIRTMIEKARSETADSGRFFIWIGIFSILAVLVISRMESLGRGDFALPALIIMTVLCGVIGFFTVNRSMSETGARSYPRTVCYSVWLAGAIPAVIVTFVLPFLGAYPWSLGPVLSCLFIGVGLFSTGVIFESKAIVVCSFVWWLGAVGIAMIHGAPRVIIVICMILLGWVLPGLILHMRYRHRSREYES